MDGHLDVLGSEKDGSEGDDSRSGLAGDEESRVNVGGAIIAGQ